MSSKTWVKELPFAVTVCNSSGIILEMNDKSCENFARYGGASLCGRNVLDCHPEPAKNKLKEMLTSQAANCYTIDKDGVKKLIYQSPWYENGEYKGFIELSLEIPFEMPHFKR